MREGRPAYKGDLHCWCARNLLRNPLLDTNFAVFTKAARENRTNCAWPGVGTETTDKRPPLLVPATSLAPSSQLSCSLFQSRLFLSIWNCCYLASKNLLEPKNQLPTPPCCCVLLSFATLPNRPTPPFPWLHSCPQTFNLSASMVKFCSDGAILAN